MDEAFNESSQSLVPPTGSFPPAAFDFILGGLSHTVGMIHGEAAADELTNYHDEYIASADSPDQLGNVPSRHVSGQQLCMGLRDFAIKRYGRLARTVLARWNIHETDDFGRIVFTMIESKRLGKTENDRFEDFRGVFDFDDAFGDLTAVR